MISTRPPHYAGTITAPVLSDLAERRLQLYRQPFRERVRALAAEHARLRDLAASFPALLFALATPRAGFDPAPVVERVIDGAGLKDLAARACLPMWLRSLPPDAFDGPIPRIPEGEAFGRQIANHIPCSRKVMPDWLHAVASACTWADEDHAVWVAREFVEGRKRWVAKRGPRRRRHRPGPSSRLRRICLWAWYSSHAVENEFAPAQKWSPTIWIAAADTAASDWFETLNLRLAMGRVPVENMWLAAATVGGFEFAPLRTADDVFEEGQAMQNCVATYGWSIAENFTRLWSIRRGGERVATIELSFSSQDPLPVISQIKCAANKPATLEMSLAARRWMLTQEGAVREWSWSERKAVPDLGVWREHWRPYWLAKRRIPAWLPLTPNHDSLWGI